MSMKKVICYTDGSCINNGKWYAAGGWGVVLLLLKESGDAKDPKSISKFSGPLTFNTDKVKGSHLEPCLNGIPVTNIRAEMHAILHALQKIVKKCSIHLNSDNEYCIKVLKGNYPKKANVDLWDRIDREVNRVTNLGCSLSFYWVKGHSNNLGNDLVDELAKKRMREANLKPSGICLECKLKDRSTCGYEPVNPQNCEGFDPRSCTKKKYEVCGNCLNLPSTCGFEPFSERHCEGEDTVVDWDFIEEEK